LDTPRDPFDQRWPSARFASNGERSPGGGTGKGKHTNAPFPKKSKFFPHHQAAYSNYSKTICGTILHRQDTIATKSDFGKFMKKIILGIILLAFCTRTYAQTMHTWTWGPTDTCGEAMQNIERYGQLWEKHYLQWILGYLSGLNAGIAQQAKKDALIGKGISADTIAAMFKNECRKNALDTVVSVAQKIHNDLSKRTP
jgi:hypothetical protein